MPRVAIYSYRRPAFPGDPDPMEAWEVHVLSSCVMHDDGFVMPVYSITYFVGENAGEKAVNFAFKSAPVKAIV